MTAVRNDSADRLAQARAFLRLKRQDLQPPFPEVALFFSVCDGKARARVVNASGPSLEAAWQKGLAALRFAMKTHRLRGKWLRIDWVDTVEEMSWAALRLRLAETKRNYFRHGLALDEAFKIAFTEQELNANGMLYGGTEFSHAVINEKSFHTYFRTKYPGAPLPSFNDDRKVYIFSTKAVFSDEDGSLHDISGEGLDAGRRHVERLTADTTLSLVRSGSHYLARQVNADGSFVYGYHPCFDRRIDTYNALRHASTTYSMIEAWEVTRDDDLGSAIERALQYLCGTLIRETRLPDGGEAAFLVDTDGEVKLGGNAVSILALAKYASVTGTTAHVGLMEKLAAGIAAMQDPESGAFVHVLNYPDLSVKEQFRTIYYEGEAAFGLMRLYEITQNPRWLALVEKAFGHFIASEHWKHHDHWLSYCVNELTRYRPEERYFRFGIANVSGHLDFVSERITTFPTLLELMMAARKTLARIDEHPDLRHLFADIDMGHFAEALEKRAHYLLNGHFWPELAMYYRKPETIAGSFFIRHHAFRVRIDDVEHYLSGYVAYLAYLKERAAFLDLVERHERGRDTQLRAALHPDSRLAG